MRKFYTSVLFIVFLFTSFSSFSQMIANDDNITTSSGFSSTTILSVTANDTFNGTSVTASNTDVTPVVNGPISIDAEGVLTLAPNTPSGTYLVTYQLCNLSTTDCDTAVVTVTITNTIDAVNDGPINVFSSPIFDFLPNVTSNDTLNGNPVTTNNSIVTPVTAGPLSIDPNGQLSLAPNVPSGTYSVTYTICEVNPQTGILVNPANCDTAVVTVVVFNSINAANDSFPSFISQPNFSTIGNITLNDTFNGTPVTPANTDVIPTQNGPLVIDSNGTLTVAPNPQPGTYIIDYTICEVGSLPLNCDTATAIVVIQSQSLNPIVANNDTIQNINGIIGNSNAGNVLTNNGNGADSFNGVPIFNLNLITLSIIVPAIPLTPGGLVPILNNSTGNISISAGTPAGTYTITYQICEIANPTNCDTAIVTISVNGSIQVIIANDDMAAVSNVTQNQIVLQDILANDTLNGIPVTLNNVTISSTSSTGGFFSIQNNGSVIANSSNIPNGSYTLNYIICENNGPNNCDEAFVIIEVNNNLNTTINGTYVDFNNDGFTNVGDIINYTFTVTNNSSSAVTNINLTNGANAPVIIDISGGPIPNLASGTLDTTTFSGTYVLTQNDITNGFVSTFINTTAILNGSPLNYYDYNTTNLNISNGIRLNAFIDTNGNGVQNAGEQNFYSGNFTYQINNGSITTLGSNNGIILYESNPANNYNLTFSVYSNYASQYTVAPASYSNITVANNFGITTYNFPVTVNPYNDLAVFMYQSGALPRPGFTYNNKIQYSNYGTQTIASGTVTFTNSPVVTVLNTSQAGSVVTASGFTYNFTNLLPGETRYIFVTMQVPTIPTVSLGQLVTNSVSITIPSTDINTSNNSFILTQVIVGSNDPNDKTESHGGKIVHSSFTSNDYLTYAIQFENIGTAEAINIRVNDILDSRLDETSLRMIDATHPYVLERIGTNLNWKFNGINLPPSVANTQIGHGTILFQIKPKPGYAIGDIIPNFASIYFDFNPAIVTDTWNTEFVAALSNENFAFINFNFYPNPVKDNLKISNNSVIDSIEILSLLGQKMIAKNVNSLETELNLSELSSGIYFVKVVNDGQAKVVKIVKE